MSNVIFPRLAAARARGAVGIVASVWMWTCAPAHAQDAGLLPSAPDAATHAAVSADRDRLGVLAFNSAADTASPATAAGATPPAFKPPFFTGSDAHKYLGLGTLAAVLITAATAPGEACDHCAAGVKRQTSGTTHTRMARTAAVLAGATVGTGLLVHWNDFHLEDGLSDPDNQHVFLGLAGSALMLYAVNKSLHSSVPTQHAGFAELGGAAMAVAVKLTW